MTVRRQWLLGIVSLVFLGGVWFVWRATASGTSVVSAGTLAPDFSAKTLEATPRVRTLADYRGQVVLLNIWASWCVPCEAEMPTIEALYREYAPRGLRVVAIATDDPGFEDRVREFVKRHGLTFEVLSEGTGQIEQLYQALGIPSTYLIGSDGIIRKRVSGASDWNSSANRALVAQLLDASRAATTP